MFFDSNLNTPKHILWRREVVFLTLAGIFLGSLTMLNILGITRFIDLSFEVFGFSVPFAIAIGVLPYPITFLCTDFISELYGRRRANLVVFVGLLLNFWVLFILWFGGILDLPETYNPETGLPDPGSHGRIFYEVRKLTFGAVGASMVAYLSAQFIDVYIFHWLKEKTKGKKLWLRNNGSTLISQLVDSIAVILITHYYAENLPIKHSEPVFNQLLFFIISSYIFKLASALLDTIPFYIGTKFFKRYLLLDD